VSLPIPSGPGSLARALALQDAPDLALFSKALPRPSATHSELADYGGGAEQVTWSELHLKLIERLAGPSLIVNGRHEIVHLSQSASAFLQFPGGEPSKDVLRVVNPGLRGDLRAALFRASEQREAVFVPAIPIELAGVSRVADIRVSPAFELAADFYLIELHLQPLGTPHSARSPQADGVAVQQLERELEKAKRHLRDVVEQHEASLEESRASNEELQAMNEELRSASEELESSREELQSINEELTTVNQELKNTVEQVSHTNSDLQNLMGATAIATVFLDRSLKITRFTPQAVALFSLIPSDVGRPLADLRHRLDYPQLIADAQRVLEQLSPVERRVSESEGRFFLARVLPYRTIDDRIAGIVLTLIDVTERETAQALVERARQELEQRVQERTAQLDALNNQLKSEIVEHRRAEKARQELQALLVNAQEEERGRISRELHDEVGQQISALMLSLKSLEAVVPGEAPSKLRELRATAERVAGEIHQVAYQLRPVALDELGLGRALNGYLEGWQQRSGITADLVVAGIDTPRLPREIETTLYRIVQEATNNVFKHANATHISVSVERRGEQVTGIIEDNGAGFDVEKLKSADPRRIGVVGMRERVAICDGELTIDSEPEQGTTVRVRLPVRAAKP
ncbi:MAG TPA: PAS domain-containing protein, partial [Polyangiaceae bacterium]|nr:PAS domain-containing protein [Polyangiaceae bacterium]